MTVQILKGDCRDVLRTLPRESVHCVVTSPPYFGLRDYGTGKWEGGNPDCTHSVGGQVQDNKAPGAITTGQRPGVDASRCRKCGASRIDSQIGLEASPDAFVDEMVAVFRDVHRVLRADGTIWINLGDSYCSIGHKKSNSGYGSTGLAGGKAQVHSPLRRENNASSIGCKHKDLIGVPWMVAFALRANGWYLRRDIIWHKLNPMPESVRDRPSTAHEYLFLLSKEQTYFYDADAILEPVSLNTHARLSQDVASQVGSARANGGAKTNGNMKAVTRKSWKGSKFDGERDRQRHPDVGRNRALPGDGSMDAALAIMPEMRNKRSVWPLATEAFSEAHFATFPPALIEPCILAGCPKGGTVLDPFGGAGTTGLVADRLGRNAILIELNPEYADMAERRIKNDAPLFADVI